MLCWKELVNEAEEIKQTDAPTKDDLKLLQIYLCRLFLSPVRHNQPVIFPDDEPLVFMGITPRGEEESQPGSPAYLRAVRRREKTLTRSLKGKPRLSFEPLLNNLVKLLNPGRVEIKVLIYAILLLKYPKAKEVVRDLEINDYNSSVSTLARAMRESTRALDEALAENSILSQIRLIESPNPNTDIWDLVEAGPLLNQLVIATSDVFNGDNAGDSEDIEELLFRYVCPPGPAALHDIGDFQGVPELQLMLDYLQRALETKAQGKNILLYGKPGTGKTQLARTMAARVAAPLYEVPTKDDQSGALTGRVRLDAAKMAQMFLEDRLGAILLFDEMEDAFRNSDQLAKGWFNQLLEENQAPVIWISNDIRQVDPAFLRRFDFIVEIEVASGNDQAARVEQTLSRLPVEPAWITEAARKPWMTPALAQNLAEVGQYLPARQISRNQRRLETLIKQRLDVMGEGAPPGVLTPRKKSEFPAFRTEWINTRPTLRRVERLVRKEGIARICLYGPPGAGKTAYAQELANRLNKPCLLQSGSDLLDMYVGQTEKNIAEMFDKAERTGAVLLLDEADSFLYNRNMAQRSWELSVTNEFMVRLERFSGVFLATTNRFESFDKAILRRFQMKVGFGYLNTKQIRAILMACVVDTEQAEALTAKEIQHLKYLTPGVIRSAVQNLRLQGFKPRTRRLLVALEEEQHHQTDGVISQPIGFIQ